MATFGEIKASVEKILVDANSDVVLEIPDFVQYAQELFEDGKGISKLKKTLNFTLTTGFAFTGPLPADFVGHRLGLNVKNADASFDPLFEVTQQQLLRDKKYYGAPAGQPKYFAVEESNQLIALAPSPNVPIDGGFGGGGVYVLSLFYWGRETTLVNDADTNWFTDNAKRALIWEATAACFEFNRDPMATYYFEKALKERKRIKTREKRKHFGEDFVITPVQNEISGAR